MNDRGMKKWRPFSAVVPSSVLYGEEPPKSIPTLSKDEIMEYEEILKDSLYTGLPIEISYFESGKEKTVIGKVKKLDSVRKNIYLDKNVINFRQIHKIKYLNKD